MAGTFEAAGSLGREWHRILRSDPAYRSCADAWDRNIPQDGSFMALCEIIYTSRASRALLPEELAQLLDKARALNASQGASPA